MFIKELEIPAIIKYQKKLFILSINQFFTKTGTASYHLNKFDMRANRLKEYKIQYTRDINSCIKHIYRYCYSEIRLRFKIQNKLLSVLYSVINKLAVIVVLS